MYIVRKKYSFNIDASARDLDIKVSLARLNRVYDYLYNIEF